VVNKLPSAGQSTAQQGCDQAANALQQCADQATATGGTAGDNALQACQDTANQAVAALKAAAGATP
jgi:hypothetical protein